MDFIDLETRLNYHTPLRPNTHTFINLRVKPIPLKKYSPYFLVLLGLIVIFLGITGSLPVILDSALVLLGLKSEADVQTMGFVPFAIPVSSQQDKVAPDVQITRSASGELGSLFPTPTQADMAPSTRATKIHSASTPEPTHFPTLPTRLVIPSIELDAPIIRAIPSEIRIGSDYYEQWEAPNEFAVGWHTSSALLGEVGNTVLNGHHNIYGRVFENLHKVEPGQEIIVYGGNLKYSYIIVNVMILPERDMDMDTRMENARWILPSTDERLTLITCWPAESNTHRLIVVAQPLNPPVEVEQTNAPADAE